MSSGRGPHPTVRGVSVYLSRPRLLPLSRPWSRAKVSLSSLPSTTFFLCYLLFYSYFFIKKFPFLFLSHLHLCLSSSIFLGFLCVCRVCAPRARACVCTFPLSIPISTINKARNPHDKPTSVNSPMNLAWNDK